MPAYKDAHFRSVAKAISYRLCAAIVTMTIVFVFTRRIALSIGVGLVESVVKVIAYYLHERVWSLISIGKVQHPLSDLPVSKPLEQKDMEIIRDKLRDLGYINDT